MAQSTCPACQSKISLGQVLMAPTPFHLKCGQCKVRLRVHSALEWTALLTAIAMGVLVGVKFSSGGLDAVLPILGVGLVLELVAVVVVAKACDLKLRDPS